MRWTVGVLGLLLLISGCRWFGSGSEPEFTDPPRTGQAAPRPFSPGETTSPLRTQSRLPTFGKTSSAEGPELSLPPYLNQPAGGEATAQAKSAPASPTTSPGKPLPELAIKDMVGPTILQPVPKAESSADSRKLAVLTTPPIPLPVRSEGPPLQPANPAPAPKSGSEREPGPSLDASPRILAVGEQAVRRRMPTPERLVKIGDIPIPGPKSPSPTRTPAEDSKTPAPATLPAEKLFQARLAVAETLAAQGHEKEAILEYQLARQLRPDAPEIARRLAVLYDREGNTLMAGLEYRAAVEVFPRDAGLLNDMGYFFYRQGTLSEAEQALRKALTLDPSLVRGWCNLGLVLGRQGRATESYEAFARVVRPAQAHSNLGVLLAQDGRLDEVREQLRQALDLEPDLTQAQVLLARLETSGPASPPRLEMVPAEREADSGPEIAAPPTGAPCRPPPFPQTVPEVSLRRAPPRKTAPAPELVLTAHTERPAPPGAAGATADLPASKPVTGSATLKGVPLPPLGQAAPTALLPQPPRLLPASLLGGTQP